MTDINYDEKDLDIFTCSCKFWQASGAQVSVAATDEEDAQRQVLEILSDHKDAEIVSIHNTSRINLPGGMIGDDDEDEQLELDLDNTKVLN